MDVRLIDNIEQPNIAIMDQIFASLYEKKIRLAQKKGTETPPPAKIAVAGD
ncbi:MULTISPECIES: hypothetical protein [unclassified Sphingopyxis]|uniref:hypothetical protein n=1 Tax=unclassified Sphingopyxis TaxID=2614943 RepID=UPI000AFA8E15|nr:MULTISPECIES: hypothetical protein [unclassified Sphingopyxis]